MSAKKDTKGTKPGAMPEDAKPSGKMTNEQKLIEDIEQEFKPLTSILDSEASKLREELDRRDPHAAKGKKGKK